MLRRTRIVWALVGIGVLGLLTGLRAETGMTAEELALTERQPAGSSAGIRQQIRGEIDTLETEERAARAQYDRLEAGIQRADEALAEARGVYDQVRRTFGQDSARAAEARQAIDRARSEKLAQVHRQQKALQTLGILRRGIDDRRRMLQVGFSN